MSEFNPLGPFVANAPPLAVALSLARVFGKDIPAVPAGDINRIYLHQSAETYGCVDGAYNAVISKPGAAWMMTLSHDPRNNARSTFDPDRYAKHTYCRNTGAVGIAVDGLSDPEVTPNDFGSEPLQLHEIEHLCACAAAFCIAYGIDSGGISLASDPFYGEPNILSHSEAANLVGAPPAYSAYGPRPIGDVERWDLATLVPAPPGVLVTATHASIVGDALRARIHVYAEALRA